jgi:F-type H+-transporting ATPase subunit alpha
VGVLPAVDVGMSVSGVGGKAQRGPFRAVAGDLKLAYAQFEELETFSRFGARLDDATRKTIGHGQRIRACLKQAQFEPVAVPAQIALLQALTASLFDTVPLPRMAEAQHAVEDAALKLDAPLRERLVGTEKLSDEDRSAVTGAARAALVAFLPKPDEKPDAKPATAKVVKKVAA